mgnify:CR=1 FL=1
MIKVGSKLRLFSGRLVEVVYIHKHHVFMIDLENDAAYIDLQDNLHDAKVVTTKWINLYKKNPGYASEEAAKSGIYNELLYIKTISVEL